MQIHKLMDLVGSGPINSDNAEKTKKKKKDDTWTLGKELF